MIPAALASMDTPALVIDEAVMGRNIASMASQMSELGVGLRPHFKTSKMIEVARRQAEAGSVGFTCATPAEVSSLVGEGHDNILWAYQPTGDPRVRFAVDINRKASVTVTLDSLEAARPLARAATAAGVTVPFLVEVDTGLGRCGVDPKDVVEVSRPLAALDGLQLEGVMTHEGHLASLGENREILVEAGYAAGADLATAADKLRAEGLDVATVSVGSTPGADSTPTAPGVTEARPGTYVFYDSNQVILGSAKPADCALTVLARVISRPRPGEAVIDAGLKAMSGDRSIGQAGYGRVLTDEGAFSDSISFMVAFEEHGVLTGPGVSNLRVDALLQIVPNHACGTVNMWSRALVPQRSGETTEWLTVARR